jgi:uncharacterized protein with GYD domain
VNTLSRKENSVADFEVGLMSTILQELKMPKYLFQGRYSPEGLKALRNDSAVARRASLIKTIEELGGKLEAAYWSFGDNDTLGVADLPNNINAATFALACSVNGNINVKTTALLTAEELDEALKKTAPLRPHASK